MHPSEELVAINANDPQLPQLEVLVRTLRDPRRGAFAGRIVLVTTGVSEGTAAALARWGVEVFTGDLAEFDGWRFAPVIGAYDVFRQEPATFARSRTIAARTDLDPARRARLVARLVRWEEQALTARAEAAGREPGAAARWQPAFAAYARKHFSKFTLLQLLARDTSLPKRVMLLDSDLVFQGPAAAIFERITPNRCVVEYEREPITGAHHIARSNRLARGLPGTGALRNGANAFEVNVGFLCAETALLQYLMSTWRKLMLGGGLERLFVLHSADCWHEQDFFRLLHDHLPERFAPAGKHLVFHAVHTAARELEETGAWQFTHRVTKQRPVLVHFAGGYWRGFPSMAAAYTRAPAAIATRPDALRTVIWGAGTDFARALAACGANERVVAVLDGDPRKHGQELAGCRITSPDMLSSLEFDRVRIASSATMAIRERLRAQHVPDALIRSPLLEPANRARLAALRDKHAGKPAVVIGNGPSLRIEDLTTLAGHDVVTFAFNKILLAFDRTPFRPSYYMVEDFLVAENNAAAIDALRGIPKLFPEVLLRWVRADADTTLWGMTHQDPARGVAEFAVDPYDVKWGASVVYSAMQLACFMGCDPIYLIGVDFQFDVPTGDLPQVLHAGAERNHFLPEYRAPGERWNKPMIEFTGRAFAAAQQHAFRTGRRFLNATRGGALEIFPRVEFDAAFPPRNSR